MDMIPYDGVGAVGDWAPGWAELLNAVFNTNTFRNRVLEQYPQFRPRGPPTTAENAARAHEYERRMIRGPPPPTPSPGGVMVDYGGGGGRGGGGGPRVFVPREPRGRKRQRPIVVEQACELKGIDVAIPTSLFPDSTGTNVHITPLNLIASGTSSIQRVGRKVHLESVRLYGLVFCHVEQDAGGLWSGNFARIAIVWNKQPSGVLPVFSDIFSASLVGGEQSQLLDKLRFDNTGRFSVVRDFVLNFNPTGVVDSLVPSQNIIQCVDEYAKLGNREAIYSGNGGGIVDISSGALYLVCRAQNELGTSNVSMLHGRVRLRYTD